MHDKILKSMIEAPMMAAERHISFALKETLFCIKVSSRTGWAVVVV